jgi:hypothetical protein
MGFGIKALSGGLLVRKEVGEAAALLCCSEVAREGAAAADHQAIRAQGDWGLLGACSDRFRETRSFGETRMNERGGFARLGFTKEELRAVKEVTRWIVRRQIEHGG